MTDKLTIRDVAKLLHINPNDVVKLINEGKLNATMPDARYIISRKDLEEYVKNISQEHWG
jgi:excisionase family DNA binding protein